MRAFPRLTAETLAWIMLMAAPAACGETSLRSVDPPALLPDGSEFRTWEQPCTFTRTYHVDGAHPAASDDNTGTLERPWKTISKAAATLAPGERVLVAAGVYRERVRPARGGTGPVALIGYEAAPGAEVVVTGADPVKGAWTPSAPEGMRALAGVWQLQLARTLFEAENPFDLENVTEKQFASVPAGTTATLELARGTLRKTAGRIETINPDGAWCWFQDERALVHAGMLTVASITGAGNVQVATRPLSGGAVRIVTLREKFDADDHNTAGLLRRADGRLMAFYARHHREPRMFFRVTVRPDDATDWGPEQSYDAGVAANFTYANPFQLPAEGGRIYNFWRGIDFNPTWSASDDGGATWTRAASHVYFRKDERPYVKYASNARDAIHFAFTEAHPNRTGPTSLYHACYRAGALHRSDGTKVRALAEGPIVPAEATRVYDGAAAGTGEAWVWDIALDPEGRPVIAYTSHPSPEDIRYRYAHWNGAAWEDHQIAFAGKFLCKGQEHYAGGIALDPDRTNVVYLSSNVDIERGTPAPGGRYEIYRGTTHNRGAEWAWEALTHESACDNLRPVVPAGHPGNAFVLFFRGTYPMYTSYRTEVVLFSDAP